MQKLNNILKDIPVLELKGSIDKDVDLITFDSREVRAKTLFVAIKGTIADGHKFIEQSIENGANAILCEDLPNTLADGVTYIRVADSHASLGLLGGNFYDHPS